MTSATISYDSYTVKGRGKAMELAVLALAIVCGTFDEAGRWRNGVAIYR